MGKKIKILPILCFAGVILLLCAALLFIENIYYQLRILIKTVLYKRRNFY